MEWMTYNRPSQRRTLSSVVCADRGGVGGQDRSTGGGASAQRNLRGRLPGIFLWIPAPSRTTRCAGRIGGRDNLDKGELDFGRRHFRILPKFCWPSTNGPDLGSEALRLTKVPHRTGTFLSIPGVRISTADSLDTVEATKSMTV